jgi:hypothetical protein
MKEFLIRDDAAFKLRGTVKPCIGPMNLWCIEFIGEEYNDKGEMINDSTYQFFLEKEHIKAVINGLTEFQGS